MYFLGACENPLILRLIFFGDIIMQAICTLLPIGLIVILLVDFSKAVIMANDDKATKSTKIVFQRIINAILVFSVPWIVSFVMALLAEADVSVGDNYKTCIRNARSGDFDYYDRLYNDQVSFGEEIGHSFNGFTNNIYDAIDKTKDTAHDIGVAYALVNNAKNEIGSGYQSKYGGQNGWAWCALFTTWNLKQIKYSDSETLYHHIFQGASLNDASCSSLMGYFQSYSGDGKVAFHKAKAYGGTYTPKPGDIIWFNWDGSRSSDCRAMYGRWNGVTNCADHIGIVESVDGDVVHTIEGNTSNKVMRVDRKMNDNIIAYGTWY